MTQNPICNILRFFLLAVCLFNGGYSTVAAQSGSPAIQATGSATVAALANSVAGHLHTDQEKVTALFDWITQHIDYDVAGLKGGRKGSQTGAETLASRRGMCLDFANLFHEMATVVGVQSQVVKGRVPSKDTPSTGINHAWNKVLINNKPKIVDTTWGAGVVNTTTGTFRREKNLRFLLAEPDALRFSHWEADLTGELVQVKGLSPDRFNQVQPNTLQLLNLGFKPQQLSEVVSNQAEAQLPRAYQALDSGIRIIEAPLQASPAGAVRRLSFHHSPGTTVLVLIDNKYIPLEKKSETESVGMPDLQQASQWSICYQLADGSYYTLLSYAGSI